MPRPTMDVGAVRRHHLSVVLGHLLDSGARSRARLAQETGLTKTSISSLVGELLERRLVRELDTLATGRVGRPGTDVAAAADTVGGLGLEIDVDHVAAAVVDLTGDVRIVHRRVGDNRDRPVARVLDRLRRLATRALEEAEAERIRCVGATLALPGLVDPDDGTLYVAPNLHWLDVRGSPAERLRLPLPVRAENEANLGALAEHRFGVGRRHRSFVFVFGGIGIGAGLVADGRLVRGAHGFAGELGHVVVDPTGPPCACGARGCLETLAGPGSPPGQAADALVAALRTAIHLVDPEAVVLGGRFSVLGPAFADQIAASLATSTLGARWHPPVVRLSGFGNDAPLVGAAAAAFSDVLADPTLVGAAGRAPR